MGRYLRGARLWSRVQSVSHSALAAGALEPIPTHSRTIRDKRVCFQVRVVGDLSGSSPAAKERVQQNPVPGSVNPFLPYDKDLYVGELTPRYRCLLNKYNAVDHHILMTTTDFADQCEPLGFEEFLAAAICLQAHDGLVFYNGGTEAGASVRHKHLQMIPLLVPQWESIPFARLFVALPLENGQPFVCDALTFPHRICSAVYSETSARLTEVAQENFQRYQRLLETLSLSCSESGLMPPHNLLLTRHNLWVVPRRQERYEGLAVNALGFAGALLVRDRIQLELLRSVGAMALLEQVSGY